MYQSTLAFETDPHQVRVCMESHNTWHFRTNAKQPASTPPLGSYCVLIQPLPPNILGKNTLSPKLLSRVRNAALNVPVGVVGVVRFVRVVSVI